MARTPLSSLLNYVRRLQNAAAVERNDYELLQQFAIKRDQAAFEALVRRHASLVWSVCRRLLDNEHDAEDAFQAVFLVLLRKSASLRVGPSLANWLHSVASRIAQKSRVTRLRRRLRERRAETPNGSDPFASVESRDLRAALDEELDRLPEKYRAPLVLCYLEGMSYTQAAKQLGWRDGTVCGRLARARELLRQRLTRRGLTLTGAALIAGMTESSSAPAATLAAVTRMASLFALGEAVSSAVSLPVVTLAQNVLHAMSITKLKTLVVFVVVLGLLTAGAGLAASRFLALKPPQTEYGANALPDKPEGEKKERTDLYGDPLPPGALVRMGTVRFRSRDFIGQIAFSPDGKLIAAGCYGGRVVLYDAAKGRELRQIQAQTGQFPAVAFAPDGKTLATAGSRNIQVWDLTAGKELRRIEFKAPPQAIRIGDMKAVPLVFSHDGRLLAWVEPDRSIRVWEVRSGKQLVKLSGHQQPVRCLAFSPDGKTLLSASGDGVGAGSVRVWQVDGGKEARTIPLQRRQAPGQPEPLCFSPDGKMLAIALYESLPPKKGAKVWTNAYAVAFIDLETGNQSRKLEPQPGRIKTATFSPDSRILAAMNANPTIVGNFQSNSNNQIHVWDTATGKLLRDAPAYAEHSVQGPCHLAFSPNGEKLAASATASALHVWNMARGREDPERGQAHHDQAYCVAFSPDGRSLASGSADHDIVLWDAASGKQRLRLRGHQGTVSALAFSPDGKLLASACRENDQTVRLWDLTTGKEIRQYVVPYVPTGDGSFMPVATWVAFAVNGKILAAGGTDRKVRRWDVTTGKELFNQEVRGLPPLAKGPDAFLSLAHDPIFSGDGRVMAFSIGKTIYIADVATGQPLFRYEMDGPVMALSPDGKTLLRRSGESFRLTEVASGRDLCGCDLPQEYAAAAFSPDGRIVAVGNGQARAVIRLFDVPTGKELLRLQGHKSYAASLAFSPDGTKLASGQWDSTALIWDVSSARCKLPCKNLTPIDLQKSWSELLDTDASKAHTALWTLVASPENSVPFLREHLRAVPHVNAERLRQLIANLDADDFDRREEASRSLAKLGIEADPALRKVLDANPSLEKRRRVQTLLDGLACQTEMTPNMLRQLRVIQALEQIGTPEARQVLSLLAKGAPAAPATRDAAAALARFNR